MNLTCPGGSLRNADKMAPDLPGSEMHVFETHFLMTTVCNSIGTKRRPKIHFKNDNKKNNKKNILNNSLGRNNNSDRDSEEWTTGGRCCVIATNLHQQIDNDECHVTDYASYFLSPPTLVCTSV